MAHSEACQLFIEEQIKEGLEAGKTPYSIGKELTAMIEKYFEASIPPETLKSRAARMQKKIGSNEPKTETPSNPCKIPDNQDCEHGGAREGAGRKAKYEKPPEPWSCALQMAGLAIGQLARIPQDDPKRQEAFQKVTLWMEQNP